MKFKGEPNLLIRVSNPYPGEASMFRFNEKGEYETEHPMTIKRMQARFTEIKEETPQKHCKKCEFTCDTQGELLAHYKTAHPKK
jgi:hypothetical protein